jgi:hypothetical protein
VKVLRENKSFRRIKQHNIWDRDGDRFKTNITITHPDEHNGTINLAPPYMAHVGIDPGTNDCDEIIHTMFVMLCRLAADADAVHFEGADEGIFWTDLSNLICSKTIMVEFMIPI